MANEGNNKIILQNSMYEQECIMVFTDLALWAGSVVDLPYLSVCVSVTLRHLSLGAYFNGPKLKCQPTSGTG